MIAIDAGHGSEDPGALGPSRYNFYPGTANCETYCQQLMQKGYRAVDAFGDYYIAHRKRTAIAREAEPIYLFRSTRMRCSAAAKGVRSAPCLTGATSETAKWLAERANQSDMLGGVGDVSLSDKDDVLAHVLLDLSMDGNRSYSIEAGQSVLDQMGKMTNCTKNV